ncbi:MAG: hypothetical protein OEZ02_00810 [Anaerolineae bacterium]|nr:hypothetical protein [Anaerolineae bacterium]
MAVSRKSIPIYTSEGDFQAFLVYPNLYNLSGEWIGWVSEERDVYDVTGNYVGWLSKDPRILRKRTYDYTKPRRRPPTGPSRVTAPATIPLAPMMAELSYDTIDILMEEPERLPTMDSGEFRADMD